MKTEFSVAEQVARFNYLEHISTTKWNRCVGSNNGNHLFHMLTGSQRADNEFTVRLLKCVNCGNLAFETGFVT